MLAANYDLRRDYTPDSQKMKYLPTLYPHSQGATGGLVSLKRDISEANYLSIFSPSWPLPLCT